MDRKKNYEERAKVLYLQGSQSELQGLAILGRVGKVRLDREENLLRQRDHGQYDCDAARDRSPGIRHVTVHTCEK